MLFTEVRFSFIRDEIRLFTYPHDLCENSYRYTPDSHFFWSHPYKRLVHLSNHRLVPRKIFKYSDIWNPDNPNPLSHLRTSSSEKQVLRKFLIFDSLIYYFSRISIICSWIRLYFSLFIFLQQFLISQLKLCRTLELAHAQLVFSFCECAKFFLRMRKETSKTFCFFAILSYKIFININLIKIKSLYLIIISIFLIIIVSFLLSRKLYHNN